MTFKISEQLQKEIVGIVNKAGELVVDEDTKRFREAFIRDRDIERMDQLLDLHQMCIVALVAVFKEVLEQHGTKKVGAEERPVGEYTLN